MKWERWSPTRWKEYELIDSGEGEKLERFGEVTLIRPEPLAKWNKSLKEKQWKELAHARFEQSGATSGKWVSYKKHPEIWEIAYPSIKGAFFFELRLTQFKHVGIFPEQASNWDFIQKSCSKFVEQQAEAKVLNLFAYTGGASMAAAKAGAEVTHLDSIKQVLQWTQQNIEISEISGVKWLLDDALKFAQREARRGNKYQGIIMDPPAWGRGPKGERWKLEQKLDELLTAASEILADDGFLVINTYSGISLSTLNELVEKYFPSFRKEIGLLALQDSKHKIDTGCVVRLNGQV
ncbi:MAG: class I SAM-dependent methyltransferase [Flavobacteriales bacterium]|nr:class I SAM-dependent methyltransferase [Flavobacteriales bacterium]